MKKNLLMVLLIIAGAIWGEVRSCSSCGSECQSACGTRHFRTCCFNYLKKRNTEPPLQAMDPSTLKLEVWLAKTRNPYLQQQRNLYESSMEIGNQKMQNSNESPSNNK